MTSPSARKGSTFERDLVKFFRSEGFDAERAYGAGRPDDVGDIELAGVPVAIEAKACKKFALAQWCEEARVEAANAGADLGVVIAKAPGRPIRDAYLIVRLGDGGSDLLRAVACTNRAESGNR